MVIKKILIAVTATVAAIGVVAAILYQAIMGNRRN